MESISEMKFDLVIAGTGLAQSLLALALSREGKKILHVDQNGYYGSSEAAFSLQDAQEWVDSVKKGSPKFSDAEISTSARGLSNLAFSRSYSLALAPQIVYSKASLLPALVSSKVYRQLEFLAVGAWWMYHESKDGSGQLKRIPGSREDVFADKSIDLKSKRALMKFLKFITDIEAYGQAMGTWADKPFDDFLTQEFNISADLQPTLHALTLSPQNPHQTKTIYALPRILRHLSSIGVFGPGFGSVIPKWGGLAEITQVACRACAVGGGIYMLDKGVSAINNGVEDLVNIKLDDEQEVRSKLIAGRKEDLIANPSNSDLMITRSISIVDSTLDQLFPIIADGSPPAACSITVFSSGSLFIEDISSTVPVYLAIHTSETGECPAGQCVIYGSICLSTTEGKQWLNRAVSALLSSVSNSNGLPAETLWSLSYSQRQSLRSDDGEEEPDISGQSIIFSDPSTDLVFDDSILREVRKAWQVVTGKTNGFMEFEDREVGEYEDDCE